MEKLFRICKIVHRLTIGVAFMTILLPIVFWSKIPDQIPSHFGVSGRADAWSDKTSLILIVFVVLFLLGMMCIVEYYLRASGTSENSSEAEKRECITAYPVIVFMNLFLQLMFVYMMYCSAASRNLGVLFLPVSLIAVFSPLVLFFIFRNRGINKEDEKSKKTYYHERERQEEGECYRTGCGLGIIVIPAMVSPTGIAVYEWLQNGEMDWFTFCLGIGLSIFFIPCFFIKYILYTDHLLIDCMFLGKERIPYKGITNIKPTYNPLSSAAMSLKRVQIDYRINGRHEMALISPIRREEFIRKVKAKKEELEHETT